MKIALRALCVLLPLMASNCHTYHVAVTGASYHFTREFRGRAYNEFNPGIGGGGINTFGNTNAGFTALYLKNSFANDSGYFIGYLVQTWLRLWQFKNSTGVTIGIATGYGTRYASTREQNPIPVAGLINDMCYSDFCLFQVVMPSYDGMSGFIAGGARYNFQFEASSTAAHSE